MSDYCRGCRFDQPGVTGENVCLLTKRYFDVLSRHWSKLQGNRRIGFELRNLDRTDAGERRAIRRAAEHLRSTLTARTCL